MPLVKLPSVQLDNVEHDTLDAAQATILSGNAEPFVLTDVSGIAINIDGGGPVEVQFNDVDFVNISLATAAEVALVINSVISAAVATAENGFVRITTDAYGSAASVQVTAPTPPPSDATAAFAFSGLVQAGVDATVQYAVFNRIPEPDEISVSQSSSVQIDLYEFGGGGGGIPTALIKVWVGQVFVNPNYVDVLAYDGSGGGFQAGFSGVVSPGYSDGLTRIIISRTSAFISRELVKVVVDIDSSTLEETYYFTALDTEAPQLFEIIPQNKKIIRVRFNEDIRQVSPLLLDDALNYANYYLLRQSVPSVNVNIVKVTSVSADTVDIHTDIETTFGAPYRLVVGNISDSVGNPFVAPGNYMDFFAFTPPLPSGRRFRLIEFLPLINREEDVTGNLRMFIAVLQEITNLLLCSIDEWVNILDPDIAPLQFLNAILDDLGNPFGRFLLDETDKRRLVRELVRFYKLKGSGIGVIDSIRFFLGIESAIDIFGDEGWELAEVATDQLIVLIEGANPSTSIIAIDRFSFDDQLVAQLTGSQSTSSQTFYSTRTFDNERGGLIGDELASADGTLGNPQASLGPDQRGLYTFCIVVANNLTLEQYYDIVFLADYFKPAHTHLGCIIQPDVPDFDTNGLPVPLYSSTGADIDHLEIGYSELGANLVPGQPGNWLLH
jgi:phage tail-like protein